MSTKISRLRENNKQFTAGEILDALIAFVFLVQWRLNKMRKSKTKRSLIEMKQTGLNRPVGPEVTRLSLEREVWGLNLRLVKRDIVLPMACHRYNIFPKKNCVSRGNDTEMGRVNSLHALA